MKRIARYIVVCLLLLITASAGFAQKRTVGLLNYDKQWVYDGYNLVFPRGAGTVYLIDNCGNVVHTWPDTSANSGPNQSVYLQPDGSIYVAKGAEPDSVIVFGKGNERIEHRDWNNNLLWQYTYSDSLVKCHHDFKVLPNGNVLLIAWEVKPAGDAIAAGRDTALIPMQRIISDHIAEVQPTGLYTGKIVWQWHAWDHLVQHYDAARQNYGEPAQHPELINLNYHTYSTKDDWLHINAIDYNPALDMILLSVPATNEVWILDHSTTTQQAAGHTGGRSGRGGDLLFRWGNPEAYGAGDSTHQQLYFQHNAHWLVSDPGAVPDNAGDIAVFNNAYPDSVSSVAVFTPVFDTATWSFKKAGNTWLPSSFSWQYTTPVKGAMFSPVASSVQLLPNGNKLICAGKKGYVFEVDTQQRIVWEYVVPTRMGKPVAQRTVLAESDNRTFRVQRYPANWPCFAGKNFTGAEPLETMADTAFCNAVVYFDFNGQRSACYVYYDTGLKRLMVYPLTASTTPVKMRVVNSTGKTLQRFVADKLTRLYTTGWPTGKYRLKCGEMYLKEFNVW